MIRRGVTLLAFVMLVGWYWLSAVPPVYNDDVDMLLIEQHQYCVSHHEPSMMASAHGITCEALKEAFEALTEAEGS